MQIVSARSATSVVSAIPFACWKVDSRFWFTRSTHCKNGRRRFDCQNDRKGSDVKLTPRCATSANLGCFLEVAQPRGMRYFAKTGHFRCATSCGSRESSMMSPPAILAQRALLRENGRVLPVLLALLRKNSMNLQDSRAGACRPEARQESLRTPSNSRSYRTGRRPSCPSCRASTT